MQVWVVMEEDRGLGPMVSGVYLSMEDAENACGPNEYVDGPHDLQLPVKKKLVVDSKSVPE